MTAPPSAPIRPAATLLLLRDEPAFQVLMVRRHHQIDFAGGALVFPGGKVEPHDGDPVPGGDGMDTEERAARIAAVREAFEESGVLLAVDGEGAACRPGAQIEEARAKVAAGQPLGAVLAQAGLCVRLQALIPFARWIAPAIAPKRYDTRFYLAEAPADQIAACDGFEAVDAEWIAPAEALRLGETGERTVIFPTRMNLRRLAESQFGRGGDRCGPAPPHGDGGADHRAPRRPVLADPAGSLRLRRGGGAVRHGDVVAHPHLQRPGKGAAGGMLRVADVVAHDGANGVQMRIDQEQCGMAVRGVGPSINLHSEAAIRLMRGKS